MPERIIEVPGVGNVAFPEGMSDEDISAALRPKEEAPRGPFNPQQAIVEGAGSILTGFGTTIASGLSGIAAGAASLPGSTDAGLGAQVEGLPLGEENTVSPANTVRSVQQAGAEAFAPTSTEGIVANEAISTTFDAASKAVKVPLSAVPFAIGGTDEAKEFIDTPLGDYLGELAQDNGASPLISTLAHIAPELAGAAIGRNVAKNAAKPQPNVPTVDELRSQSRELYKVVDQSGITLADDAVREAAAQITDEMLKSGVRSKLTPKTFSALREINKDVEAGGLSLSKAEELRRVINQGQRSLDPADVAASAKLASKWDNFVENLKPNQLAGGSNPQEVAQFLKSARSLWQRSRKTELMEEMIDLAETSPSGFEKGLQQQFRSLDRDIVKKKPRGRGFSPEEIKAIRQVSRGDITTNAFRGIGKLAPSTTLQGGALGGAGAAAGFFIAGPAGAVAVPALALGSKFTAKLRTSSAARKAAQTTAKEN